MTNRNPMHFMEINCNFANLWLKFPSCLTVFETDSLHYDKYVSYLNVSHICVNAFHAMRY